MASPKRRIVGLDGLRALAVALVVLSHVEGHFQGGGIGVAVFFVLSGYLITGLLAKERRETGSIHLGLFYARRALRLWPALIAMLIVTVIIGASVRSAALAGLYTTDIVNIFGHAVNPYGHTWSLGVEEQFYLLWPLLLPLALSNVRRAAWILAVCTVASVVGCWIWTLHSLHTTGAVGLGIFNPLWQGHGLLIGCILALVGGELRVSRPVIVANVCALAIVAIAVLGSKTVDRHWATWWNLATELVTAILIIALREVRSGLFTWSPVVWIGQRSYAIYLWHVPLIILFERHGVRHAPWVAVAASVVAAALSAWLVEAPFLRLKDRLHPAQPSTPRAAPPAAVVTSSE